jgi:copper chaperone CopZ
MRLRFYIVLSVLSICASESFAGLKWVDVGVDGLTCSMCTRSVEMSLRRLDFVDSVVMSLENTEGRIFFQENMPVNLNEVARAVVNAGFSVRFVKLEMAFDDIELNSDGSFV